MAYVTPLLWPHSENPKGHRPIWLRVQAGGRTLYHSLGVYIHPRFWNERQREVRKGHPQTDLINALISQTVNQIEAEELRRRLNGEPITAEALKAAVQTTGAKAPACFLAYGRTRIEAHEAAGLLDRAKNDGAVFNKLEGFVRRSRKLRESEAARLPFGDVTAALLRDFHAHLTGRLGNKASTANKNVKRLGAYFREAQAEGVAPTDLNPWAGYRPAKEAETERARLSRAEVAALAALDLPDPYRRAVRDAFLFSLYAAGVRFADMAGLRVANVRAETNEDGQGRLRLVYLMGKNQKLVDVALAAPAAALIGDYLDREDGAPKEPGDLLFPFLGGYDLSTPEGYRKARGSQNALYNRTLKSLAAEAEVKQRLTSHVARHTFADLARREGWDTYYVSKSLNHHSLKQTQTYLATHDRDGIDARLVGLFPNPDG